jgi:hypothetical protein
MLIPSFGHEHVFYQTAAIFEHLNAVPMVDFA